MCRYLHTYMYTGHKTQLQHVEEMYSSVILGVIYNKVTGDRNEPLLPYVTILKLRSLLDKTHTCILKTRFHLHPHTPHPHLSHSMPLILGHVLRFTYHFPYLLGMMYYALLQSIAYSMMFVTKYGPLNI